MTLTGTELFDLLVTGLKTVVDPIEHFMSAQVLRCARSGVDVDALICLIARHQLRHHYICRWGQWKRE